MLEDKGDRIYFADGKVIVCPTGSRIDNVRVIKIRKGRLYRLMSQPVQALVHDEINPSELWHRRYDHLHYTTLLELNQIVSGVPKLQINHEGVRKDFALGKNINCFQVVTIYLKKCWI